MRNYKQLIHISVFVIFLLVQNPGLVLAQVCSPHSQADSTLTHYADGSIQIEYSTRAFDFGIVSPSVTAEQAHLDISESEKIAFFERNRVEQEAKIASIRNAAEGVSSFSLEDYAVGEIPIQEGVSPTGARTYQIPIITASEYKFIPSISLGYNSQAGEGWAGYGWDIQGLSSITLANKNMYYHGIAKGANVYTTDAVFALDGVPLVRNIQSATLASSYPLITASGNILVCPNYNAQGFAVSFTVKYPDGTTAQFGNGTDADFNLPIYPITEITDLEGNKITFEYYSDSNNYLGRLTSIRYGFDQYGHNNAEISFSYAASAQYSTKYYAGKPVRKNYQLTGISSDNNGVSLCQYSLDYEQDDNVSLLSQVSCSSNGSQLRPLIFEYGSFDYVGQTDDGHLYLDNNSFHYLSSSFSSDDYDFIYRRGKFVTGSFNDGVLIYPYFDNYGAKIAQRNSLGAWEFKFDSLYPEDQTILFAPSISDFNDVDISITTGSGFQTIEAVDVDGDGLDELVKVNFNGISTSNTKLLITIYKCSTSGTPVQNAQFEVLVKGTILSGNYLCPYRREYFWGDFRGNGKVQLLTVAYDKNYHGGFIFNQISYAALIDLADHSVLCDSELFDYTLADYKSLFACDIDNDAKTELCHATNSGLDIYRLQDSSSFDLENTYSNITSSVLSSNATPYYITDINGDGYVDIMVAPTPGANIAWSRYAFNGASFVNSTVYLTSRMENDALMFIDLNQDGLSDLVKISGTALGSYINRNGSSFGPFTQSPSTITDTKGIIPCNIVDYSGMSSFIKVDGFYIHEYKYSLPSPELRCLSKSVDSMGKVLFNSYEYLPTNSRYCTDSTLTVSNSSGYSFRTLPIYILESEVGYMSDDSDAVSFKNKYYNYFNSVVHNLGLGFCGFSKIRTYDFLAGDATNIIDEFHDPQKMGAVTSVISHLGTVWANPYSTITNTYDDNSTTFGKLDPRLTCRTECNNITGVESTTYFTYGSYDLITKIETSRRIGTGEAQTETITRTYENCVTVSKYILGNIGEESIVKEMDGDTELAWKEKSVYTYDGNYRPLTRKRYVGQYGTVFINPIFRPIRDTIAILGNPSIAAVDTIATEGLLAEVIPFEPFEPIDTTILHPYDPIGEIEYDADNLISETQWQYDSKGNVISEKSSNYGATEFVGNTYTYDIAGRFLQTKRDELGRATDYDGYNKFGKPTTSSDYRNRTTLFSYDDWGNLISTTYPDGTIEQNTLSWGGAGLYTVSTTVTGKPETVTHYDALGREIRHGVKRFDGQWQWTDKEYNANGLLSRTSLPYRGEAASNWDIYTYDAYGRLVSIAEASGKTTTKVYDGTSITTIIDGITSTSTTDASGNVVSVTDVGGTITYTLRDDGQPSKITAPGNIETTFSYDEFGRRTNMVDPSAGTQTDSYVWNSDGSSITSHTNPHGTIKTYRDKYGRTTLVERPGEFDTAYIYDMYGLLSEEQSTNGTGIEYSYDTMDRVVTAKETVPDGKWLQKSYTYGQGSIISGVQYTSQDGQITTESYTYSNGHNTGITLPDNTVVWSLTSENDLGLATGITTGGITREYGFSSFGIPTYRKMDGGDLQDFAYNFSVATGNLLSRTDNINEQVEAFSYDSLNRLIAIDSREIVYDSMGNVQSMDGVGSMTYGSTLHPYRITSMIPEEGSSTPRGWQNISYTSYNRPSVITERSRSAAFTYSGNCDRVKMHIADGATQVLTRYYIGGRYEYDQTPDGTKERLYLGGDAYSAPMVYQKENNGAWTAYNIGRDYLGNITHIATLNGSLVAEYSYDPWGRLRNPETLEIYSIGNEPELFLGRGYTGHEHLTWFGLINMNARLYDPLLGRFLSPDPYIQTPDFTQNFNRYSYALNNPLKFTDESGEWVHILIGAILGGIGNLICNWNNCEGFWEYLASFAMGAAAGAAVAATGGAAAAAGGFLATAGVIGVGAAGGALNSATGEVIKQTGKNFEGIDYLDWKNVGISAAAGSVSGAASAGVGIAMAGVHIPIHINGTTIESPLITSFLAGTATGAVGHVTGGTLAGVLCGDSFGDAFLNSFNGIGSSMLTGGIFSAASSAAYCIASGINPFNGKQPSYDGLPSAKDLGLENDVNRIMDGTVYPQYKHDGTTFSNREGILPSGVTYKEYVIPPISGNGPGVNRIVVGSDNNWYYTADHYKIFIKFKP